MIQRFEYAPFGRETFALNPNLQFDPAYTGQKYDIETGLYYYRARYYNPILGRFIQPDTIVQNPFDPQSWNRYAYVRNNPLKYTDPTGNKVEYDPATDTFDYSADKPTLGVAAEFREYAGGVRERVHGLIADEGGLVGAAVVTATLAIHVMTGGYSEQVIKAGRAVIQAGSWLLDQVQSWGPQVQLSPEEEFVISSAMGMMGGIRGVGGAAKLGAAGSVSVMRARQITVLGKYPQYMEKASELGARRFSVPTQIWDRMTQTEQWVANKKFLDRAINRGDQIILADPVKNLNNVTGSLRQELDYLIQNGFRLSEDGLRMLRP